MKLLIPGLYEPVSEMRYIGRYLSDRLGEYGIYRCVDVIDWIYMIYERTLGMEVKEVRKEVKRELEEMLSNRRGGECIESWVGDGYKVRESNKMGYNVIVGMCRRYIVDVNVRRCIPVVKRARKVGWKCEGMV